MTPWAVASGAFSSDDLELFRQASFLIDSLPDIDLGCDDDGLPVVLSCHILARAMSRVLMIPYRDGQSLRCEHSWLELPGGHVLDVYPVGILGGPLLVDGSIDSFVVREMYRDVALSRWTQGMLLRPWFLSAVTKVEATLRSIKNERR